MMNNGKMLLVATLFSAVFMVTAAHAGVDPSVGGVANYIFSASNTAGFPDTQVGTLRIEQIGADTKWTLTADWDNKYNAENPFVFGVDFDLAKGVKLNDRSLPLFDVLGQIEVKKFDKNGVFFNPSNNTNRFTDGEAASWLFHGTTLSNFIINDLHINAIDDGKSVKFGAVGAVPEPETYAMLLVGIGALAWMRRRKAVSV
jgi:hypothetical protein